MASELSFGKVVKYHQPYKWFKLGVYTWEKVLRVAGGLVAKNFTFSCRVWPHLSCHTVSLSTNRQLFSCRISTPSCYLSQNNFIFIAAIRLLTSQSPNTVMKSVYELWIWRYPQWCFPRLTHLWNVRHMYRSAYFPKLAQSSRELCNYPRAWKPLRKTPRL